MARHGRTLGEHSNIIFHYFLRFFPPNEIYGEMEKVKTVLLILEILLPCPSLELCF